MRSSLMTVVALGGVDTLAVSEGVVEVGVATVTTETSRSQTPGTTAQGTTRDRSRGRYVTTAKGHEEDKCPPPADMQASVAMKTPDSDSGSTTSSVAEAVFLTLKLEPAGCGHLQGKCGDSDL